MFGILVSRTDPCREMRSQKLFSSKICDSIRIFEQIICDIILLIISSRTIQTLQCTIDK